VRIDSVVETQEDYLALELAAACRTLLDDVLALKRGQSVVITVDTKSDARVARATAAAVFAAGGLPVVLAYHTQPRPQMDLPPPVAAAVAAADIWIEYAVAYTVYSPTWKAAVDKGVQYVGYNGIDVDGFVRCIGRQDVRALEALGDAFQRLIEGAKIRVTSAAGSDVTFENEPGPVAAFRMRANEGRIPIMLAGQVSWTPIEASLQGRLVADGVLFPPEEVVLIAEPVSFEVADGRIHAIAGGREARALKAWIAERNDATLYRIAHVSMGFNPGVRSPTGRVLEDERAFGDIDFGWGAWVGRPAAGHFDFTCRQISMWANGEALVADGRFVHPTLASLSEGMR
jgi:leucyl aminopeptidase (aminopeptidase T)